MFRPVRHSSLLLFGCHLWQSISSASGETIARIYNLSLVSDNQPHPLTGDVVWNAFYLRSLLDDHARRDALLDLPHGGAHSERFGAALHARNERMAGVGQPHWAHACDDCEQIIRPPPGSRDPSYSKLFLSSHNITVLTSGTERIHVAVMDGVTLGHPRCNEAHCTEALGSSRDRFCRRHNHLNNVCAMDGCSRSVSSGFRTCDHPGHRAHELKKREEGQAIFKLKRRLEGRAAAALARTTSHEPAFDILDDADVAEELSGGLAADSRSNVLDRSDVADILGANPRRHHSQKQSNGKKKRRNREQHHRHNADNNKSCGKSQSFYCSALVCKFTKRRCQQCTCNGYQTKQSNCVGVIMKRRAAKMKCKGCPERAEKSDREHVEVLSVPQIININITH